MKMLVLSQIIARVGSNAAASTSSPSLAKEVSRVGSKACKPLKSHYLVEREASCILEPVCNSLRGSWMASARIPLGPIRRHSRPSYLFLNTHRYPLLCLVLEITVVASTCSSFLFIIE